MSSQRCDIVALAAKAKQCGIDNVERVAARLERIIERNSAYLEYRKAKGRRTSHDEVVEGDQTVLAMAIVLLESLQQL